MLAYNLNDLAFNKFNEKHQIELIYFNKNLCLLTHTYNDYKEVALLTDGVLIAQNQGVDLGT